MSDDILLDTTIHEASTTADELEMLQFALERVRAQFAWKCGGLDAEALRKPHPPSAMTLAGLLKHMAFVDDYYVSRFLTGQPMGPPWDAVDFSKEAGWEWRTALDDSPEDLYALWKGAVERSHAAWAQVLADGGLDQPSKFTSDSGWNPNLRRVLVDTIEEYLRHTGHVDLFREAVDGLVGNDPPQPS